MPTETNIFLRGKSLTTIVIDENATELTAYAASELQKYMRKTLGYTLEIKRGTPSAGCIHLVQKPFPEDRKSFDRTSIKDMGGWLELAGENPISVLYVVYDFLKSSFDIQFFAAGEAFEYIPQTQAISFQDDYKEEFGSAFEIRDFVNRTNSPDVLSFAVKTASTRFSAAVHGRTVPKIAATKMPVSFIPTDSRCAALDIAGSTLFPIVCYSMKIQNTSR